MLTFPHSLPSSSQCHFRFSKFHAETFGLFPADCFSGCRLGEICRLPMLHGPSGYSQPCAGAAFLSAHSLCRGSAQDTLAALVSSSSLLPELHPGVSVHVFRMPRDSDQVSEHQLHGVSEAAAWMWECLSSSMCSMPRDCTDGAAGANASLRARHTRVRQGKPAKLSQFPTPTLENNSAPHSCKAQQAWTGPDNGHPCGTGRQLTICTDAFFPSFYLRWTIVLFPSVCFHRRPGYAPRGSALCWARSCSLQRKDRRAATLLRHRWQVHKLSEFNRI